MEEREETKETNTNNQIEKPNPYNKIDDTSAKWSNNYKKVKQWAVTEKVHGSNFSFVYDVENRIMKYAKRSGLIEDGEHFFKYQDILPELEPKIMIIINNILENKNKYVENDDKNVQTIIVYGELFGGLYPNMKSKYKPIQKGIYYSPNIHFIAFDIYINYENCDKNNNKNKGKYLDFAQSIELFKMANIMHTEPLAIYPSYEKASFYKLGFNTGIPAKLGLPELSVNKAEGIVIRSFGSEERYIIKKKIPEFSETKYSDNSIKNGDKKNIGLTMITENRLNNAASKIGPLEDYRYQIYELLVEDILSELDIKEKAEKKSLKNFFMEKVVEEFS